MVQVITHREYADFAQEYQQPQFPPYGHKQAALEAVAAHAAPGDYKAVAYLENDKHEGAFIFARKGGGRVIAQRVGNAWWILVRDPRLIK